MSAFHHLATPAPAVEAAIADRAAPSEELRVEPARPSEDTTVEAAKRVEPAVLYDDPRKFAPPMTQEQASHLSIKALRASGVEFESKAAVIRGGVPKNILRRCLPLCFDERDFVSFGEVLRYLFVKGNCILVYGEATAPSPLYAIQIASINAEQEDPRNPHNHSYTVSPRANTSEAAENLLTILLKDKTTNKIAYQVTFDTTNDKGVGKRFLDILNRNAKHYGDEILTATVVESKTRLK
eukprot:scaffold10429_cov126-Cylindrotheca_fusiformis.AAC.10